MASAFCRFGKWSSNNEKTKATCRAEVENIKAHIYAYLFASGMGLFRSHISKFTAYGISSVN